VIQHTTAVSQAVFAVRRNLFTFFRNFSFFPRKGCLAFFGSVSPLFEQYLALLENESVNIYTVDSLSFKMALSLNMALNPD
jgi:hypothetical protein